MFGILFRVEAKPKRHQELIKFLKWDGEVCRDDEPGTLRFEFYRDPKDGNALYVYEAYRDESAFEVEHQNNEPYRRWSSAGFQEDLVGTSLTVLFKGCAVWSPDRPHIQPSKEAMSDRKDRWYKTTDLSTLRKGAPTPADHELLLKLYEQTCTTWRTLVDVRFKLFALVPTVSLISLATVFSGGDSTRYFSPNLRLLFAVLGLVATLGLLIYELRNSQLHDDLISRGRKIEDELGVDTGVFRGRKLSKGLIKHDYATILIYGAALLAWVAAIWISGSGVSV